jgi:hypothetical protein
LRRDTSREFGMKMVQLRRDSSLSLGMTYHELVSGKGVK